MARKLPVALAALGLVCLCAVVAHAEVADVDVAEVDASEGGAIGRGLLGDRRHCKRYEESCGRNCCKKHEHCAYGKAGRKCVKDCKREKYECGYKCCKHGEKCYEFGRYHKEKECVDKYFCKNDDDCADLYGDYTCNKYRNKCVRRCDSDYDCGRYQYCDSEKYYCVHKCHDDYDCYGDKACIDDQCVKPDYATPGPVVLGATHPDPKAP